MLDVAIKYNPYKVVSTITVNGETPKQNSKLIHFLNQRFQMWVDQIPDLLVEEYNDDEFYITFWGTELDYQDLLTAVKAAEHKGYHFQMEKKAAKEFGDKEKELRSLIGKARELPFEQLQSPDVANAIELAFNELLEVNVVATMSAGKSTLINALLGKKLMPSKQGACTATITKIQDDDDDTFKATAVDSNKTELSHYSNLDYKTMKELNQNPEVSEIQVMGNIPFVTSDEVSLVLIDTPGPDNARDKRHGEVTARALDQSSKMLVLFVMNGGKLHDEAQDAFLRRIAKSMSVGGKQSRERFLFVINKMDAYDEEDDDIAGETIPDTIKYLEDMGIDNPNIFPAAAEPALLIKMYLDSHDEAKKAQLLAKIEPIAQKMIDQEQLHLEKYPHLVGSCQAQIDSELRTAIEEGDILGQALIHSGIRGIEETIRMYVTKYCRPAKITNVVNAFKHALDSAEAFETTRKEIAQHNDEQTILRERIELLTKKLTSKAENDSFKKRISKLEVTSELTSKVQRLIANAEGSLNGFFSSCPSEMEEDEAMAHIRKFARLADSAQNEFQVSVDCLLQEDIKKKSQQLLNEYIKKLKEISDEFSSSGLKIDLSAFVQGTLAALDPDDALDAAIDSRTETHTERRTRTVTKRRSGWNRVFHPSCWFNPEYQTTENYTVEVKTEITFISREKLVNELVAPIRKRLYEERERIIRFAEEETKRIKDYFYTQFDRVDDILAKKAMELQEATLSKKASEEALAKANRLLKQLETVRQELDSILEV